MASHHEHTDSNHISGKKGNEDCSFGTDEVIPKQPTPLPSLTNFVSGSCLYDLLRLDTPINWSTCKSKGDSSSPTPQSRLDNLLSQSGNKLCADCGTPDPKWVSFNHGSFICIKCSGVHRSLGVHISKILSVNLDEWSDDQVDALMELGGNDAVNLKFEAYIPDNYTKPKPGSSIEDRSDFIWRKYEQQQFLSYDEQLTGRNQSPSPSPSTCSALSLSNGGVIDKKIWEKHTNSHRIHLGNAFRYSRRRKESEPKVPKKSTSMAGMVEFVGLIKVNVVRGTNLAVRDMMTSDPYVILSLGTQSVKTRVIRNNLNPVWNEKLMLSIPDSIPPLKLYVYDKDTFKNDDFMGDAEIDIQPLVSAAKEMVNNKSVESMQLGKWVASKDNSLVRDGIINLVDGKVSQEINLKLQNVERGVLQIELECMPLTQ